MSEDQTQQVSTRFNSALPFILVLRGLIFGKQKPDLYTRIAAYLNLFIWITFFIWHIIGFSAISLREIIYTEKKINVEELIFRRGHELGFRPYQFLNHLLQYHLISIICWGVIFVGIALMWRKKKIFVFLVLGSLLVYLVSLYTNMGLQYFIHDTTLFDKILLSVIFTNSLIYYILLPKSNSNLEEGLPED